MDGERYGVHTRLIAKAGTTVGDLGVAVVRKLLSGCRLSAPNLGAIVLSSRVADVQETADEIRQRLATSARAHGIERACSGFPAATEVGVRLCQELELPVVIVTAEIISTSINWEPASGDLLDHQRARGQAAKLFGDGAAAALMLPARQEYRFEILHAWAGEVPDDKQLIQKTAVKNSMDPWGQLRPGVADCISMPGRRGFLLVRRAPQLMAEALSTSVQAAQLSSSKGGASITHVVPPSSKWVDSLSTR